MSVSTDAAAVKAEQRRTWDAVSDGWTREWQTFERGGAALTTRLLALGGVRPGHRVLDVATGPGEPALSAADVVGPTGTVTGVDLSPAMVAVARHRAAGQRNVNFLVADLETMELPPHAFDVVLSRLGLMFAVDPDAAFRRVARLLAPGGVLAAAVWGPPARVPLMSLGYGVLARLLDLPSGPPGSPGPYRLCDPQALAAGLDAAGLSDVTVAEYPVPFRFDGPGEYARFTRAVAPPPVRERVDALGAAEQDALWAAVAGAAERHVGGDGVVELTSTALTVRAVAPG
ncbi:class I SAM-dependent methyltransferase [Verrucosispora sp. WMMD573]|uniref:class I SAM-dependent methyltransferase n=1 Tax=Verrucosispora sp. WMMD573 TaxID=3015149 RepID=UPI00248C3599|nr:class I SAM-dependent methyltransferase [Verrucosispora sp. WMMD573]WBB53775.1 class I SAM-dependent methyltransferase [Verrucosispora sp. WMMD573]